MSLSDVAHRRGVSAVGRIVGQGVPPDNLRQSSNVKRYDSNSFGLAWATRREDGGYRQRYRGFQDVDFDSFVDLDGPPRSAWWWGSPKEAMHRYVDRYFRSRREDG